MNSNFLPLPEHPEYLVNSKGSVYSTKSNKELSSWVNNKGRYLVTLSLNGTNKHYQISRLVARVFGNLPSLDSDLEVDHKDSDKSNNDISNLIALSKADHLDKTLGRVFEVKVCKSCGGPVSTRHTKLCISCVPIKSEDITVEQIEYWVKTFSWVRAGRELGLSDNGLRKRYTKLTGKNPKEIFR